MAIRTNPQRLTQRLRSEAGVSLIHVAIASFVIMGFSAFVIDHGVLMLARAQAQNVADMAALAGVTTRAMDEAGDAAPAANSLTVQAINRVVDSHVVFGDTPANTGRLWYFSPTTPCPTGITGWCVKVEVFRDGTNSSTMLPTYFGPLFGLNTQRVRATATAVAASTNGTRCMKPWLIPDKWQEAPPPRAPQNITDRYQPSLGDTYTPFNYVTNTPGTGWSLNDVGTTVILHGGPGNGNAYGPSFYFSVGANSGAVYQDAIETCHPDYAKKIGDTITSAPGGMQGPTNHGVNNLIEDGPVDVIVGMFSPQEWLNLGEPTGNFTLTIVNLMSIRVVGADAQGNITGVITGGAGEDMGPGPTPAGTASLVRKIQLVR